MEHSKKIKYDELSPREQEEYNFQRFVDRLAQYNFRCEWVGDDDGVDFLAFHNDIAITLPVQLKARLALNKKYVGKNISIAFIENDYFLFYPHDEVLGELEDSIRGTISWDKRGEYHWPQMSENQKEMMEKYALKPTAKK